MSSGTAEKSGWNQNPETGQHSFLRYRNDHLANPSRAAVVLVEDNAADIFLVQQVIAVHKLDVNLYVMNNGADAITFFRQLDSDTIRCPDILLLDLNIPKVNGFSVLSHLRASDRCHNMAVIIMTSSDARADRERSASLGASAYFNKPSSYGEFLALGDIIKKLLA